MRQAPCADTVPRPDKPAYNAGETRGEERGFSPQLAAGTEQGAPGAAPRPGHGGADILAVIVKFPSTIRRWTGFVFYATADEPFSDEMDNGYDGEPIEVRADGTVVVGYIASPGL